MPKLPDTCKYCHAASSEFVEDESSGQLTCTECGSQLGGTRVDSTDAGEARVYTDDGVLDTDGRVNRPCDALWEGLDEEDGQGGQVGRLKGERKEGFDIVERAGSNLGLGRAAVDLAKTYYKDVHMRKTVCATYKEGDADACDAAAAGRYILFKSEGEELSRISQATQAAACLYIAARSERMGRTTKEILGACKQWHVANKQLNKATRAIARMLRVELPNMTAAEAVEHWALRLQLPSAVAQAAAEIADNCGRVTVTRSAVEICDFARLQELQGLGYSVTQQITPSANAAGSAAQIMCCPTTLQPPQSHCMKHAHEASLPPFLLQVQG
jgi:hypothetical protein